MISKDVPYSHLKRDLHVMSAVMKGELPTNPNPTSTHDTHFLLWLICCQCWKASPNERVTISQIVNHLQSALAVMQQQQPQQQPFAPPSAALANGPTSNNTPLDIEFFQAIRSSDGCLLTIDELRFRFGELKAKFELDRKELLNSPKLTTQDMVNALIERHIHLQQREAVVNRIGEHIKGLLTQQAQQQQDGMQSRQSGPSNNNDGQGQGSLYVYILFVHVPQFTFT